jgi:hypothetical protein
MMMMILLLNRYGHKPIVSKFLVIVFSGFPMLLFCWILFFIFVTSVWCFFTMSFVVWIRLKDPTMLPLFPSVRVVGFSFSLSSSSFESYDPFLFSSVLIRSWFGEVVSIQCVECKLFGLSGDKFSLFVFPVDRFL